MKPSRIAMGIMVVGGVLFGFAGGEYGTMDWWQLRQSVEREHNAIERLEAEIDSLEAVAIALEQDPATVERVARERFGMLRPGELLFRVETGSEP